MTWAPFFLCFIFYLLIPVLGAGRVRRRWRRFRRRVYQASRLPRVSYSLLYHSPEGCLGIHGLFASLQGVQGRDSLWIEGSGVSLQVSLGEIEAYTLPRPVESGDSPDDFMTEEIPPRPKLSRILSYSEGTRVFVAGRLFKKNGRAIFMGGPDTPAPGKGLPGFSRRLPVMLIFYDGPEESLFFRAIRTGRDKNELQNPLSLISIIAGCLFLGALAYLESFQGRTFEEAGFLAGLAALPLLMFLPPGILFLELYRSHWNKARRLRADRDCLLMELDLAAGESSAGERKDPYRALAVKAMLMMIFSWLCLIAGILVNYYLFMILSFYFLRP
ncbi:MAG: hypothetical protein LBQ61_05930 [Spirochaetales bacterium]|jgi:hypothetical protein|nr:hypothetical protein [Spirochaetales bacterium]